MNRRTPILYLAPWVDIGGSDRATIDWFRWLDRDRFEPSLITTQPSANRRMHELRPYAKEIWSLPDLMPADSFPAFIFDFIAAREIELVHIMNSRIGFDLLPDMSSLVRRPATVVQLHVEEEDRSGYVRYVTTRYGNLVDSFSVSGHHLAAAMADYDVPLAKRRVIHTGVDADWAFDPDRTQARALAAERFHVLFVAHLVEQKDPRLMLEVAARVAARTPRALFHVIGDGPLEAELRRGAGARGLDRNVVFHGASTDDLAPWYSACHALLLTSRFEGIPCSALEAMAMGLPVVAPGLPGLRELMDGSPVTLIEPRDDPAGYADALARLADDEDRRLDVAAAARAHVRSRFSVRRMAAAHAELYDELLERRRDRLPPPARAAWPRPAPPERIALTGRPTRGQPLVSVIVPCFNHGLYLPACLAAIGAQTYPAVEIVVVDDASTDPGTLAVIAGLDPSDSLQVIRQPVNRGPSAARNAALDVARGRYVLPVDADNLLLPGAIEQLVGQLQVAGETVGFIYPNPQYFGNRDEYFEAPDYNVYALMRANYCDTCSLFDRDIFAAGVRFAEDIELGHEDWDLMLQLAARGVGGQPARGRTLLYRKHGFTRSDTVQYAQAAFFEDVVLRHPSLYGDPAIKARDCPGLSVIQLEALADPRELELLALALGRQTLLDVELIAAFAGRWPRPDPRCIRRIPPDEAPDATAMLAVGLALARAGRVLVVTHDLAGHLRERSLLEQLARALQYSPQLDAIGLIDAGAGANPLGAVHAPRELAGGPHAVVLNRRQQSGWPRTVEALPGRELESLLGPLAATRDQVHWCHLPASRRPREAGGARRQVALAAPAAARRQQRAIRDRQLNELTDFPRALAKPPRRWVASGGWTPPETVPLVRFRDPHDGRYVLSIQSGSPAGCELDHHLGVVQRFSPPGTVRLEFHDGDYRTLERGSPHGEDPTVVELGHIECAPLPLLLPLLLATHLASGQRVLLGGFEDPLAGACEIHGGIGFLEGLPVLPRGVPVARDSDYGLRGLLRVLDGARRVHVYAIDHVPTGGRLVGELGGLLAGYQEQSIPLWIGPDGLVHTDGYRPRVPSPDAVAVARWAAAPVAWRDFGRLKGRVRSVGRRALDVPRILLGHRNGSAASGGPAPEPDGYLFGEAAAGRAAVWAGVHPITGDQLLTRNELEAPDMGYADVTLLGFLRDRAPVTGKLELRRTAVPWASRFGLSVRPS